jgi:hypothetical protein
MITEREKTFIEAKAYVFKAPGHPTRLWMAERLAAGELCVESWLPILMPIFLPFQSTWLYLSRLELLVVL